MGLLRYRQGKCDDVSESSQNKTATFMVVASVPVRIANYRYGDKVAGAKYQVSERHTLAGSTYSGSRHCDSTASSANNGSDNPAGAWQGTLQAYLLWLCRQNLRAD